MTTTCFRIRTCKSGSKLLTEQVESLEKKPKQLEDFHELPCVFETVFGTLNGNTAVKQMFHMIQHEHDPRRWENQMNRQMEVPYLGRYSSLQKCPLTHVWLFYLTCRTNGQLIDTAWNPSMFCRFYAEHHGARGVTWFIFMSLIMNAMVGTYAKKYTSSTVMFDQVTYACSARFKKR